MGVCCSKEVNFAGFIEDDTDGVELEKDDDDDYMRNGDYGARVRLQGSSTYISMYTQQGKKGINQDSMSVWEDFVGEKGMFFCGVFDGHGPLGHRVAQSVREALPSKLSSAIKSSLSNLEKCSDLNDDSKHELSFAGWETNVINSFKEIDEELNLDASIDSYCSGSTAVTIVKKGDMLLISNLGDSRAVLCTRGEENQLVSVQLTVDLKPNIPNEAERIENCRGRVFALDKEPGVFRIWVPDDDYPGLAMSRCFGDFCLKDHGLSSIPQVSYRKLTEDDEFVVLATDGIWDVLSNNQVIKIVASAKRRSIAAKLLVSQAVRKWRTKYPGCSVDDCTAVCLYFKNRRLLTKSLSEVSHLSAATSRLGDVAYSEVAVCPSSTAFISEPDTQVTRVDTMTKLPKYPGVLRRRRSSKDLEDADTNS